MISIAPWNGNYARNIPALSSGFKNNYILKWYQPRVVNYLTGKVRRERIEHEYNLLTKTDSIIQ